jgi:hypothetical protein
MGKIINRMRRRQTFIEHRALVELERERQIKEQQRLQEYWEGRHKAALAYLDAHPAVWFWRWVDRLLGIH